MSSTRPLPLEAVLIRSLQLIQTFGLPTVLPQAPVRNWSSLFVNRMLNVVRLILVKSCRLSAARHPSNVKCLDATSLSLYRPIPLPGRWLEVQNTKEGYND
jgi:hypothetical protein